MSKIKTGLEVVHGVALLLMLGVLISYIAPAHAGTLTCSVTTAAACTNPSVVVLRMSSSTNAHAELSSQSNAAYSNNVVCCSGVTGLGNSCSGTNATVVKLSSTTNAHAKQSTELGYTDTACLSVPAGGSVTVGYQGANCSGYDTTLLSMDDIDNAHVGTSTAYVGKVCGTADASAPSLSFVISDQTIGFGTLSSSAARFATGDLLGSATEVGAHTLVASTTAGSGYTISVRGATMTSQQNGSHTITAIGATNTGSVAGVEQFGIRLTATGGVGTVTAPYAASGFAYAATASTPSQVASATTGNGVDTTYSVRYLTNIAPETEAGSYTASLVYVITANF